MAFFFVVLYSYKPFPSLFDADEKFVALNALLINDL